MDDPVPASRTSDTTTILSHWIDAVPNDRLAHLVRDATRAFARVNRSMVPSVEPESIAMTIDGMV